MPHDRESYVHRIGRTGRAGRVGNAILMVTPAGRGKVKAIERLTRQSVTFEDWPSVETINERRVEKLRQEILETIGKADLSAYRALLGELAEHTDTDPLDMAAALAHMARRGQPLELQTRQPPPRGARRQRDDGPGFKKSRGRRDTPTPEGMRRYRVAVGHVDGVRPGNLVGAIAGETNLESGQIGSIQINKHYTTVDLPARLDPDTYQTLKRTRVAGKPLQLRPERSGGDDEGDEGGEGDGGRPRFHKRKFGGGGKPGGGKFGGGGKRGGGKFGGGGKFKAGGKGRSKGPRVK